MKWASKSVFCVVSLFFFINCSVHAGHDLACLSEQEDLNFDVFHILKKLISIEKSDLEPFCLVAQELDAFCVNIREKSSGCYCPEVVNYFLNVNFCIAVKKLSVDKKDRLDLIKKLNVAAYFLSGEKQCCLETAYLCTKYLCSKADNHKDELKNYLNKPNEEFAYLLSGEKQENKKDSKLFCQKNQDYVLQELEDQESSSCSSKDSLFSDSSDYSENVDVKNNKDGKAPRYYTSSKESNCVCLIQ